MKIVGDVTNGTSEPEVVLSQDQWLNIYAVFVKGFPHQTVEAEEYEISSDGTITFFVGDNIVAIFNDWAFVRKVAWTD